MPTKIAPVERLLMLIALQNFERTRLDVILSLPPSADRFEACTKLLADARNGLLKCLKECKNNWDESEAAERAIYSEMEEAIAKDPMGFKPPTE